MKKSLLNKCTCALAYMCMAFILSACEHKELCELHPHVKTVQLVFDWQHTPQANPEGMCVYFYPINGSGSQRFDFIGKTGGEIKLQVGAYRVLCYNNDTEAVMFRNSDSFDTHEGFTRLGNLFETVLGNAAQHTPRTEGTEEQSVVISPDMMWGCSETYVNITDDVLPQSVTLYPQEQVCTYTYEVKNIKYLNHVAQVCGSISGMSGAMLFASGKLGTECVTIPFESVSDGVSSITGQFYTFGHAEENTEPHHMMFYVWMDDGKKYAYGTDGSDKFNVTEQIHTAPDKRHVHIVIDGLDLPQPMENGSGFDVSVDDWEVIEEDIIL